MTLGLDIELFWRSSLRTVVMTIDARLAALRREQNARAWTVWHIALLSRMKRLPKLDTLYVRERGKPNTWQESNAMMWRWYRAQEARKAAAKQRAEHG